MQLDFFSAPKARPPAITEALTLQEDTSASGYASRTIRNAKGADLTIALAMDFETAGERLTKRAAADRYYPHPFNEPISLHAEAISRFLQRVEGTSLNVAGNGIYTLATYGYVQEDVNLKVFQLLKAIHAVTPLSFVRSGGQTGVDWAGLVGAVALGIPALGLFPAGYVQRDAQKRDRPHPPEELRKRIMEEAKQL